MSRRKNSSRHRQVEVNEPPAPTPNSSFDHDRALARWKGFLKTATGRGFAMPPFLGLMLGPVVRVDPEGDEPGRELRDRSEAEIIRRTLEQKPS